MATTRILLIMPCKIIQYYYRWMKYMVYYYIFSNAYHGKYYRHRRFRIYEMLPLLSKSNFEKPRRYLYSATEIASLASHAPLYQQHFCFSILFTSILLFGREVRPTGHWPTSLLNIDNTFISRIFTRQVITVGFINAKALHIACFAIIQFSFCIYIYDDTRGVSGDNTYLFAAFYLSRLRYLLMSLYFVFLLYQYCSFATNDTLYRIRDDSIYYFIY